MIDRRIAELRQAKALLRYQIISPYLADNPPRGQRTAYLERLAGKTWVGIDGEPYQAQAETLRKWVRQYRKDGLDGLMDAIRTGQRYALSEKQIEFACQLKREVPERSLERVIEIMEIAKQAKPDEVKRSTLYRHLRAAGLSRAPAQPDSQDLGRFEASYANALWQSDMLQGPWLPDPKRPGKMRRASLFAFIDDYSRFLLDGRFSFKEDLPTLELVFRRAIQKCGLPTRVYYDNGQVYRAHHMQQIVAELGICGTIFTKTYRPMGHGKIEAFNRQVRRSFLSELKASTITTVEGLNEAFWAWAERYNRDPHGQTGQAPLERWKAEPDRFRFAEEEQVRKAFLWSEKRRADKTAMIRLFNVQYEVDAKLAGRSVEVRYDPERLEEIEIWWQGEFRHRTQPFNVGPSRRPKAKTAPAVRADDAPPTVDFLAHLIDERRQRGLHEPTAQQLQQQHEHERLAANLSIQDLLRERLDPAVLERATITRFLDRYGPFDLDLATWAVEQAIGRDGRTDHHVHIYLEAIRQAHLRGTP